MAKWQISKDFFCDYGHRVWTQELQEQFCAVGDTSCKCKHLHGHTGMVTVEVGADTLNRGFVTDFKHLGFMKDFVDEYFDHRFIIDVNDPLFNAMTAGFNKTHSLRIDKPDEFVSDAVVRRFVEIPAGVKDDYVVSFAEDMPKEQKEYIESFTVVDFVPTSENLAKFIFDYAREKLGSEADVISVTWKETPKSKAVYCG